MNVTPMLERLDAHDAWRWGLDLFEHRDYYAAATVLQHLVDTHPHAGELGQARELLARAYFHAALVGRAEACARDILERDPTDAYAALLLARSLERLSRREEAAAARRLAAGLAGGPAAYTADGRAA